MERWNRCTLLEKSKILLIAPFSVTMLIVLLSILTMPKRINPIGEIELLYPQSVSYINDYKISSNQFIPVGNDPQIGFYLDNQEVACIQIDFKEKLKQNTNIQVFYASNEESLSEGNSVVVSAPKYKDSILIQLPRKLLNHIRVDIDGSFLLDSIGFFSESPTFCADLSILTFKKILTIWTLCTILAILCYVIVKCYATNIYMSLERFRELEYPEKFQKICVFFLLFFCSCILQAICQSKLCVLPLIPLLTVIILAVLQLFFKKSSVKSLTIFSVFFTLSISAIFVIGNIILETREKYYLFSIGVLWLVGPSLFARKFLLDCGLWLAELIKKYYWLLICFVVAIIFGFDIEFGYVKIIGGMPILRRGAFYAVIFFIIIVFFIKGRKILQFPEKLFLLIALPIGCYLSISLPVAMLVSWDDEIHYERTVSLSQSIQVEYSAADVAMIRRTADNSCSEYSSSANIKLLQRLQENNAGHVDEDWKNFHPTVVGYLPAAMGIWAGKVLQLPFWGVFVLGRFGNFLCYATLIYYAIKRLINGKILLMIIGLIPTNLFLASNYSYDPWVTSMTILGFAYFWGALQRPQDKITVKECLIMLGALYIGIFPKYIYFIFIFVLLLIPKEKFPSEKKWRHFLYAVIVCIIASVVYLLATYLLPAMSGVEDVLSDARGGTEVNGKMQILFILTHPFIYAKILLRFLWIYLSLNQAHLYISYFAYIGVTTAHMLPLVMMFSATLTDCVEKETLDQKMHIRTLSALTLFATVSAVATSLYIGFTPVGFSTVMGCQLRYLLPLLFPFFALVLHQNIKLNVSRKAYNCIFFLLSLYCLTSTVWNIYVTQITP